jgi:hypothetical protein
MVPVGVCCNAPTQPSQTISKESATTTQQTVQFHAGITKQTARLTAGATPTTTAAPISALPPLGIPTGTTLHRLAPLTVQ